MDILLMDKGNKTYTSYKFGPEVTEYQMDMSEHDEDFLDYKLGHIHSHNDMNTYFSGQDLDELRENSPNHNLYLSLIVNNWMDMVAKVAFIATPSHYTVPDENGTPYELEVTGLDQCVMTYDCEITQPYEDIVVDQRFADRLAIVQKKYVAKVEKEKEEAAEKAKKAQQQATNNATKGTTQYVAPPYPGHKGNFTNASPNYFRGSEDEYRKLEAELWQEDTDGVSESPTSQFLLEPEFMYFILTGGSRLEDGATFDAEDILDKMEELDQDETFHVTLVDHYTPYYAAFYEPEAGGLEERHFEETIERVMIDFEGLQEDYHWLINSVKVLQMILTKYNQITIETNDKE